MVEIPEVTPNDIELYKAIRAQLSASPLQLNRVTVDNAHGLTTAPLRTAAELAAEHHAALIFWIQQDETKCMLFFYSTEKNSGHIHTRMLDLVAGSRSSRFETIGNAVSSVIEESIAVYGHRSETPPNRPPPQPVPRPKAPVYHRKWMEIFAGYAGTLFASRQVTHGVQAGVGFFPGDHITAAVSFTQNLAMESENADYRFTLVIRNIEVAIAARIVTKAIDIHLGLAWSVDLRSYSTVSFSETITVRPDAVEGVYSLTPFVKAIWSFSETVGIMTGIGPALSFNERLYTISQSDGRERTVLRPFLAKLTYNLGFAVQL